MNIFIVWGICGLLAVIAGIIYDVLIAKSIYYDDIKYYFLIFLLGIVGLIVMVVIGLTIVDDKYSGKVLWQSKDIK